MNYAIDEIIYEGNTLNMGHRLGHIKILKIDRVYRINKDTGKITNRKVDWKKTTEHWKKTGERKGLIFFSDDWYVKWNWDRRGGKCRVAGSSIYSFKPTHNSSRRKKLGTKGLLADAVSNDPNLHLKYEYIKRNEV